MGGAHDDRIVHLQSDSALSTKHGDAVQEALREGRRPLPSQTHPRKGLRTHQKPGRDGVQLQLDREQLLPHLKSKNASRDGEQKRRFHRNTTKSASRGQAALAATRSRVTVVRFQRRHARQKLCLARWHAGRRAELHLRSGFWRRHASQNCRIASAPANFTRRNFARGSLACGKFAQRSYTGGIIISTSAYSASAAPRKANGHANRRTLGVTPAAARSRAASLLPVPVTTRYAGSRNNNRATLAEIFEAGTLQRLSQLELAPPCYAEDIAHQANDASFNVEYAYVATNALGSFSGGRTTNKSRTLSRRR